MRGRSNPMMCFIMHLSNKKNPTTRISGLCCSPIHRSPSLHVSCTPFAQSGAAFAQRGGSPPTPCKPLHAPSCSSHHLRCCAAPAPCRYILQTYVRPDIVFTHGEGARMYDAFGKEYLDFAAGIAVNALGACSRVGCRAALPASDGCLLAACRSCRCTWLLQSCCLPGHLTGAASGTLAAGVGGVAARRRRLPAVPPPFCVSRLRRPWRRSLAGGGD